MWPKIIWKISIRVSWKLTNACYTRFEPGSIVNYTILISMAGTRSNIVNDADRNYWKRDTRLSFERYRYVRLVRRSEARHETTLQASLNAVQLKREYRLYASTFDCMNQRVDYMHQYADCMWHVEYTNQRVDRLNQHADCMHQHVDCICNMSTASTYRLYASTYRPYTWTYWFVVWNTLRVMFATCVIFSAEGIKNKQLITNSMQQSLLEKLTVT